MGIKQKFVCIVILLQLAMAVKAADIVFVVYFAKGKVNKAGSKTVLKKGDAIAATETLVLAEQASVVLICSNYKAIQVNKKGNYAAGALLQQCNNAAGSYTGNYFKYVWNEFSHKHGQPETNPREYMKNVGAVSRGCNTVQLGMPTDTIHYYNGALPLYWSSVWSTVFLSVYDMPLDGAPLQKTMLQNGQPIAFDKIMNGLQPGEYYWQMNDPEGNACERTYVKLWDKSSYAKEVERLTAQAPVSMAAETAFAKAFILQENHFLAEALKYYRQASKLAPKNLLYQKALNQFYETAF